MTNNLQAKLSEDKRNVFWYPNIVVYKSNGELAYSFHSIPTEKTIFAVAICIDGSKEGEENHFFYLAIYKKLNKIVVVESCRVTDRVSSLVKKSIMFFIQDLKWNGTKSISLSDESKPDKSKSLRRRNDRWSRWTF